MVGSRQSSTEVRKKRDILHGVQHGLCFWCDCEVSIKDATLDEVVPISRGGTQRWNNIVMACRACNEWRGNDHPPRWAKGMVIAREVLRNGFP